MSKIGSNVWCTRHDREMDVIRDASKGRNYNSPLNRCPLCVEDARKRVDIVRARRRRGNGPLWSCLDH